MVQLVILSGVRSRLTESMNWWQRKSALSCTLGKALPCFFSWSYRSSFDGTSRVWDSVTGDCLCSFDDHKKNVYALAFSPDGRHIATAGGDGCLHIYDIRVSLIAGDELCKANTFDQAKEKRWSWSAGTPNSSIFEIEWQQSGNLNRIAMAMEKTTVGVVDLTKVPELQ